MLEHLSDSLGVPLLLAVAGSGPMVSDLLIGLACCGIAVALALLARKRRDLPFRGVLWMLAAFLLACGATQFFSLAALWAPLYRWP